MFQYGVATVSRIDKNIGLLYRIWAFLQGSFAKETYDLIDPTNRSHPVGIVGWMCIFAHFFGFPTVILFVHIPYKIPIQIFGLLCFGQI